MKLFSNLFLLNPGRLSEDASLKIFSLQGAMRGLQRHFSEAFNVAKSFIDLILLFQRFRVRSVTKNHTHRKCPNYHPPHLTPWAVSILLAQFPLLAGNFKATKLVGCKLSTTLPSMSPGMVGVDLELNAGLIQQHGGNEAEFTGGWVPVYVFLPPAHYQPFNSAPRTFINFATALVNKKLLSFNDYPGFN